MKTTLCTLFEGHYHHGVAALVNSLVAAGYEGKVWVGHRGTLPSWITGHAGFDGATSTLRVTPSLMLHTIALDPPLSLNYYKPTLMRDILRTHEPDARGVIYLDPDLVVKCPWPDIQRWCANDSIGLVEDANWSLPARDPKRVRWQEFFAGHGEAPVRTLERYYNSGFVGASRAHLDFLDAWARICGIVAAEGGRELRQRKIGLQDHLFHSADEDALNFALTLGHARLHTSGPEAMDFTSEGRHLSHAVGANKPWQGRHLRRALRGEPPTMASKWFYRFASGPLAPFSHAKLARRRLSMSLATAVGHVHPLG